MGNDLVGRKNVAVWDERRNSSRVFPVEPDVLPTALRALRSLDPALRQWIEEGHPHLTDNDHVARFGCTYSEERKRKTSTARRREDVSPAIGTAA